MSPSAVAETRLLVGEGGRKPQQTKHKETFFISSYDPCCHICFLSVRPSTPSANFCPVIFSSYFLSRDRKCILDVMWVDVDLFNVFTCMQMMGWKIEYLHLPRHLYGLTHCWEPLRHFFWPSLHQLLTLT